MRYGCTRLAPPRSIDARPGIRRAPGSDRRSRPAGNARPSARSAWRLRRRAADYAETLAAAPNAARRCQALMDLGASCRQAQPWPTSAAATAHRRSSWRRPTRARVSSATTVTQRPSCALARPPPRRDSETASASRPRAPDGYPAPLTGYDLIAFFDCSYTVLLALGYAPIYARIQALGARVSVACCELSDPLSAEWPTRYQRRKSIDEYLNLSAGPFENLRSALTVLAPFVGSILGSALPGAK